MPAALVFLIAGYLLGSISFAVVASKLFRLPDPHSYGSGNPGATNVLRSGSKPAAILTLLGDAAKGWLAVWLAAHFGERFGGPAWIAPATALAVFIGHLYPVFHRFAGGKGVATAAGIVYALNWPLGIALTVLWLAVVLALKISSVAALVAAAAMPVGMFYLTGSTLAAWVTLLIAVALFWRHRNNIRQLMAGRERRIGR